MSVGAILLAAGRGERLGAAVEKGIVPLGGRPLFVWSLETLARVPAIAAIVVVGPVVRLQAAAGAGASWPKVVAWCEGGRQRQDSVACGLARLPEGVTHVAIHDAARPLVTVDVVRRVVADALEHGAAIAAVPVEDTLKRATLGVVDATVPRAQLWRAQTPQAFRRDWLVAAHAHAAGTATDDASLIEAAGHRVRITQGDTMNLKITTAADLRLAEAWVATHDGKD